MKRIGFFMALALVMATSSSFAKSTHPIAIGSDFGYSTQSSISSETVHRILKLTSEQTEYTHSDLMEMYSIGQVTIAETSDQDVYLVTIQQADGGAVEVIILDSM